MLLSGHIKDEELINNLLYKKLNIEVYFNKLYYYYSKIIHNNIFFILSIISSDS